MKILQVNSVANSGSTGRIAEEIGNVLIDYGHESHIAYGRGNAQSNSQLIKIGSDKDVLLHGAYSLLTDRHGFASKRATQEFVLKAELLRPDLIVLHNLHGYYLHLPTLFNYINQQQLPVVWTFHDCWPFTGHCTYFDSHNCEKWRSKCNNCPKMAYYPRSLFFDNSAFNFERKKDIFTSVRNFTVITPSRWLANLVGQSFFFKNKVVTVNNGINIELFKPRSANLKKSFNFSNKRVILGCASEWSNRKGFQDFIELADQINSDYQIVMIGLSAKQLKTLPSNIIGLCKTESIEELAQWYSLAFAFVNPTSQDNFPTTNLEALACGTPVITYNTGGSPEAIDESTGFVVEKGDVARIVTALKKLETFDYEKVSQACRARAERLYDKKTRYLDYLSIFERVVSRH